MTDNNEALQALKNVCQFIAKNLPKQSYVNQVQEFGMWTDTETIRKALQADQWQDISTAPKDGTEILVHASDRPKDESIYVVFWKEDNGWVFFDNGDFWLVSQDNITDWQPLPEPPSSNNLNEPDSNSCQTPKEKGE